MPLSDPEESSALRPTAGVYGLWPAEPGWPAASGTQFSPLMPGAAALEAASGLRELTLHVPPGTIERQYALACALRALAPGGRLTAFAAKDKGGARVARELTAMGCTVDEQARRHLRICRASRPESASLQSALEDGAPRMLSTLDAWTQPGVFSWDRRDPGTALLLAHLPPLVGHGADFGCGLGLLARAVLAAPAVREIALIDIDRRAVAMAARNVTDPRARFHWEDLRRRDLGGPEGRTVGDAATGTLDFVVMNPPFHTAGREDQGLGQCFVRVAAQALRPGGVCWLTANRHLPYEAELRARFSQVALRADADGYKIYEATR